MDMNSQGNGARLASLDVARGFDMLWIMGFRHLSSRFAAHSDMEPRRRSPAKWSIRTGMDSIS